jgi:hypothetical protein
MASQSPRTARRGTIRRRIAPGAAALIASAVACAPASASSPTIVVRGDSVLATSLPSFGPATIEATRPDALTGAPVVIGLFAGSADQLTPFSVNSITPTPLSPSGDCWQSGALSQALTPDLQPGDTVTLRQAGGTGSSASSTSVVIQPGGTGGTSGPIAGCSGVAPWARNAITSGPGTVTDGPITVSGVAQPLATGVSIAAGDGSRTTAPVSTTPASDGSWSATIPASQLQALTNTSLTVRPVMAVPDVATGVQAHIAGVGLTVTKPAPAAGTTPPHTGGTPVNPIPGTSPRTNPTKPSGSHNGRPLRASGLRAVSPLTLARARRDGIQASLILPAGAKIARVELLHGKNRLFVTTVRPRKNGSRQTVLLRSRSLGHILRAGQYTIAVQVGASGSALGPVTTRQVRIR